MTESDTRQQMMQELDNFLRASEQIHTPAPNRSSGVKNQRDSDTVVAQHAYVVEKILDQVTPGWRFTEGPTVGTVQRWDSLREAAARGRAALIRGDDVRGLLGDGTPQLDTGQLHRWAWESAESLWRTRHFHQAVMQASVRINAETRTKLGRPDLSEVALFNQAFSLDPPSASAPRLRLMEDNGSDTYRNVHRGARAFAEGLFTAIRNPGVHDSPPKISEHEALEQLAAFSILARWVEKAWVVLS